MSAPRWAGLAAGVLLIVATIGSVVSTTVVPRGTRSRLSSVTARLLDLPFRAVSDRIDSWERRDHFRAFEGPAFVLVLLVVWLVLLLLGYALVLWPFVDDLGTATRISGSSLFTLGTASAGGAAPTAIVFTAAATGLVVIALQIGYLPALYSAFNRREVLVTVLAGVAGAPAWGPEILARHALVDSVGVLPRLYERWTDWAADVAESHVGYSVLRYFRSPAAERSWVVSLLAVLDAAALHMALDPVVAPPQARTLMNAGILAFRDLAVRTRGFDDVPVSERTTSLTREDFDRAVARISRAGFVPERTPDEAWRHFCGWRVNYEAEAYALARAVDAVPAVWSGPRYHAGRTVQPRTPGIVEPAEEGLRHQVEEIQQTSRQRRARRAASSHSHPTDADGDGGSS